MAVGLLALVLLSCQKTEPQQQRDKDEENGFVVAQELSNSRVQCIAEDKAGQLWIGTFRGLNRYDGHEYHQYFCADDTTGLPDNQIKDVLCDQQGQLWVATVNGVCRYTRQDCFKRIEVKSSNLNIQKLLEDSKGRIFIYNGTEVMHYDDQLQAFHTIIQRQMEPASDGAPAMDLGQLHHRRLRPDTHHREPAHPHLRAHDVQVEA